MTTTLYWEDRDWQRHGKANNVILDVHHDDKTYEMKVTNDFCVESNAVLNIKRKANIRNYMKYLDSNGYTRRK